jgi:hypothetical protein
MQGSVEAAYLKPRYVELSESRRAKKRDLQANWRANNPDKALAQQIQKYGVTVEWYKAQLEKQGGRCAICSIPQTECSRRFAVDHDHQTNQARGLLCGLCNTQLGVIEDSVWTARATAYLAQYKN